mmetsp:Transcript_5088/g.19041  ORF Transcript_5088/g.19041 Transcript_5088/m.19041 type:complete len:221 (+) Transcript_5088:1472-2134(+)
MKSRTPRTTRAGATWGTPRGKGCAKARGSGKARRVRSPRTSWTTSPSPPCPPRPWQTCAPRPRNKKTPGSSGPCRLSSARTPRRRNLGPGCFPCTKCTKSRSWISASRTRIATRGTSWCAKPAAVWTGRRCFSYQSTTGTRCRTRWRMCASSGSFGRKPRSRTTPPPRRTSRPLTWRLTLRTSSPRASTWRPRRKGCCGCARCCCRKRRTAGAAPRISRA